MKERIAVICSLLGKWRVFADIGCDHGYCTEFMLRRGLCERAYISDISAGSLQKAETLLGAYVADGRCIPVVADGLSGIPEPCDGVLIAGMGGEEIVKILAPYPLPAHFLLQPMKNSDKVRSFLLSRGAGIERDFTFSEGNTERKYYDLILGNAVGGDRYTEKEIVYGRDNLNGSSPYPFLFEMREELEKTELRLLRDLSERSREKLLARKRELEEIIYETERTV